MIRFTAGPRPKDVALDLLGVVTWPKSSSRRRRCYDGNPRTRVEHGTRVPHVSVRFTHEGSASNANESRLRVGCQASGGARLGPDVTGAEAGTGISAGGMTPTTSDAT